MVAVVVVVVVSRTLDEVRAVEMEKRLIARMGLFAGTRAPIITIPVFSSSESSTVVVGLGNLLLGPVGVVMLLLLLLLMFLAGLLLLLVLSPIRCRLLSPKLSQDSRRESRGEVMTVQSSFNCASPIGEGAR